MGCATCLLTVCRADKTALPSRCSCRGWRPRSRLPATATMIVLDPPRPPLNVPPPAPPCPRAAGSASMSGAGPTPEPKPSQRHVRTYASRRRIERPTAHPTPMMRRTTPRLVPTVMRLGRNQPSTRLAGSLRGRQETRAERRRAPQPGPRLRPAGARSTAGTERGALSPERPFEVWSAASRTGQQRTAQRHCSHDIRHSRRRPANARDGRSRRNPTCAGPRGLIAQRHTASRRVRFSRTRGSVSRCCPSASVAISSLLVSAIAG